MSLAYGVTSPAPQAKGFRYRIEKSIGEGMVRVYRWEWVGGHCPRLYGWNPTYMVGPEPIIERKLKEILGPDDMVEKDGRVYGHCPGA